MKEETVKLVIKYGNVSRSILLTNSEYNRMLEMTPDAHEQWIRKRMGIMG